MDLNWGQSIPTIIVAVLMTVGAWVTGRFSIKTKVEDRVSKLEEKVAAMEKEACEIERLRKESDNAAKAMEDMQAALKWLRDGFPVLFRGLLGLLQTAKDGKTNGEVEDALKEVNIFLTNNSGKSR